MYSFFVFFFFFSLESIFLFNMSSIPPCTEYYCHVRFAAFENLKYYRPLPSISASITPSHHNLVSSFYRYCHENSPDEFSSLVRRLYKFKYSITLADKYHNFNLEILKEIFSRSFRLWSSHSRFESSKVFKNVNATLIFCLF